MIQELFQLYADRWQFFLKLTLQHLEISLIAIVAALCIGLSLGILISSYRRSSSLVLGLTNFMYTIPSIALFGFLIPFSGIGDTTAIFALTVYALLPMVRNTYTGITGIDREIIEAARMDNASEPKIIFSIMIPMAKTALLTIGLLSFISLWNSYFWPLIMTTKNTYRPLAVGVAMLKNVDSAIPWHMLMAGNLFLTCPILIAYAFANKQIRKAFVYSGIK